MWPQGYAAADRHASGTTGPELGYLDRSDGDAPYNPAYHPFSWRAWQDFGAGAMGDMGCHVMDAAFAVLKLGDPTSVHGIRPGSTFVASRRLAVWEARRATTTAIRRRSIIHLSFPARGDMPPVKLHWYDGGLLPERPDDLEPERRLPSRALSSSATRARCGARRIPRARGSSPRRSMPSFTRPPKTLPRVPGGRERTREELARRDPQSRAGGLELRLRRTVQRGRPAGQRVAALPGQRLMWDAHEHEGHQHVGRQPVRPAQLPERVDARQLKPTGYTGCGLRTTGQTRPVASSP